MTILCYDAFLTFADEVRGRLFVQGGVPFRYAKTMSLTHIWPIGATDMELEVGYNKIPPLLRESDYLPAWIFLMYIRRTESSPFCLSF